MKRRFWPRKMVGQLVVLMVIALLLANLIALVGIQLAGSLLHPMSRSLALERLTLAYRTGLPALMHENGARFWESERPEVDFFPMQKEERRLTRELKNRLALPAAAVVLMQLERSDGGLARSHIFSLSRWQPLRLRTTIALADGRYLNAVQPMFSAYEWSRLLAYALPVASVPLLIGLFFMVRIVRPVKTLAEAAEQVSRGEWTPPLPLTGPQEARELTSAFNQMQLRLARHIESRTRMLAAMSHDLNTPLTGLRLQVELLEPGPARDDMLESLNDLRAMVSETLNFVRGESSQEQSQHCSLTSLVDDLVRRYRLLNKNVKWQGAEEITIVCRPVALRRALGNLIDNALAYGGDAELNLYQSAAGVQMTVLDHGPGIAPENLAQALEPFVRLHAAPARPESGGGLGLGLSIARACLHAHGGELTLENRPPAGLCAVIDLPSGIKNRC